MGTSEVAGQARDGLPGFKTIALAINPWDRYWKNRQQLLSRLGRCYPILYSTGPLALWQRGTERWSNAPFFSQIEHRDNVWIDVPGRFAPRVPSIGWYDSAVISRTARRWKEMLSQFDCPLIVHVFHPQMYQFAVEISGDVLVYHAYDLYEKMAGVSREMAQREQKLVQMSDLAIGSSRYLVQNLERMGAGKTLFLPNAVDFEAFSRPVALPQDLEAIPQPRIGYVGSINRKVNLELLAAIAALRPDWNVVLVGEVSNLDEVSEAAYRRLCEMDNVYLLGARHHSELPGYVAALDVGLMNYRTDDRVWTMGIYPLKLHEYLASGIPVVSSSFPSVQEFSETIDIVDDEDPSRWVAIIEGCIDQGMDAEAIKIRRSIARANNWETRVQTLEKALNELVSARASAQPRES